MDQVRITRVESNSLHGTFGVLSINSEVFCVTLEPYWRDNEVSKSCISSGQYIVEPYYSPKYGNVYLLKDVAGRSMVEFHPGNIDDNTQGCILLGQYFGKLKHDRAILNSGYTFSEFKQRIGTNKFHLTIVESY